MITELGSFAGTGGMLIAALAVVIAFGILFLQWLRSA